MAQSHSVRGPACMVLDDTGKVRWWGQSAIDLLQVPATAAEGNAWWDLLPQPLQVVAQEAWRRAQSNGGGISSFNSPDSPSSAPWQLTLERISTPGQTCPLWHGVLAAPEDNNLIAGNPLQERLFDAIPDVLVLLQKETIIAINNAAEDFFGVPREQVLGQPLCSLGIYEDVRLLERELSQGNTAGTWWLKVRRKGPEQEPVPVETHVAWLDVENSGALLLCFRQPSQQLTLRKGLLRAQHTQSLGPVINGIIHDFNNHFTAILSNLDLAETSASAHEDCLHFIRNARTASQNGAEVIRHLQLFSRKGSNHPELIDPRVLLQEIITLMKHCLGRAVQVAKLHIESAPGLILGRPGLLRQMLINICLNAREAMPCGGELSFTLDKAEFLPTEVHSPRRPGLFARIIVADTGCGMAPEVIARLQQPFFTTHADRELGLGLFAVNEILALHGGWMEVDSQKAKGTRIHIFLPARAPAVRTEPVAQDALLLQQKKLEGTERLLVVEPDSATRTLLKAVLGYRGYEVIVAASGEEALQSLSQQPPPQMLLTEVHLPDMTGWQLLNRLRHQWPDLKVLLMVQEITPELVSLAHRVRAELLSKPVENQRLLMLIRECLNAGPAGDRSPSV